MRDLLRRFLAALGLPHSELTVLLTDDPGIRALNREHRGLDKPTDILSWSYLPPGQVLDAPLDSPHPATQPVAHLGDLALSVETAARQARDNGWDLPTEAARLLAHGCAHLVGHDHQTAAQERRMLAVELRLLAAVGLRGLYPDAESSVATKKAPSKNAPPKKTPPQKALPKKVLRKGKSGVESTQKSARSVTRGKPASPLK